MLEQILLYPAVDRVLPLLPDDQNPTALHAIAGTGGRGLLVLLRRVSEALNRDSEVQLWRLQVAVEGVPLSRADERVGDCAKGALAERIQRLVESPEWEGGFRYDHA